jgi:hypothetical protein
MFIYLRTTNNQLSACKVSRWRFHHGSSTQLNIKLYIYHKSYSINVINPFCILPSLETWTYKKKLKKKKERANLLDYNVNPLELKRWTRRFKLKVKRKEKKKKKKKSLRRRGYTRFKRRKGMSILTREWRHELHVWINNHLLKCMG